jgi:hypothetical protein
MSIWTKKILSAGAAAALLIVTGNFAMSSFAGEDSKKVSEQQAVKLAEKFISENGYTTATADSAHLAPESLAFRANTPAQELALRHNTLEPKAYGILPGGKSGPGWTVIFQYSKEVRASNKQADAGNSVEQRGVGRAVTMDEFGRQLVVQHKDIFLKACQKKLPH